MKSENSLFVKIIYSLVLILLYFPLFCIFSIFVFEHSGSIFFLQKKLYDTDVKIVRGLENTLYYDKKNVGDPYNYINNLKLHPHYFSISQGSLSDNSHIVSLDEDGFRKNLINTKNKSKGVFLGGSVAFGHGVTSNYTTIPSFISKFSKINFKNLAQPVWNSSQELASLLLYDESYDLSISFTLANDINTFCHNKLIKKVPIDSPEVFSLVNQLIEDSKKKLINYSYLNEIHKKTSDFMRDIVYENFPDIYNFLQISKRINTDIYIPFQQTEVAKNCVKHFEELKEMILNKQLKMYQISRSRGADHIIVFQPLLHFHNDYNFLSNEVFLKNEKNLIQSLIKSEICKKIKCINLTNFFDTFDQRQLVYDPGMKFCYKNCFNDNIDNLYNFSKSNLSYKNNFFIDNYHLTDFGSEIVSKEIIKYLN